MKSTQILTAIYIVLGCLAGLGGENDALAEIISVPEAPSAPVLSEDRFCVGEAPEFITITWDPVPTATAYQVFRYDVSLGFVYEPEMITSLVTPGLYSVRAHNEYGWGPQSEGTLLDMLILGANPSTLDFGTVEIGSEVILQTNFTGNALAPFEVNVAPGNSEFQVVEGAGSHVLDPGETLTLTIRYRPSIPRPRTYDIDLGLCGAKIHCVGEGNGAWARLSDYNLDFGLVPVGETSLQTFTISNDGTSGTVDGTVAIQSQHFFLNSGQGSFSLEQGQSWVVEVVFSPQSGGGHESTVVTGIPGLDVSCFGESCADSVVIYVDDSAGGTADGRTWANAYTELTDAITDAALAYSCGDGSLIPSVEIWVAEGTYPTPTNLDWGRDSFELKNGIALYGGFMGNETDRCLRDIHNRPTILTGEVEGPGMADNAQHVVFAEQVDDTAVLDGFTITGGFADGSGDDGDGAGILVKNASPILRNLVIRNNATASSQGQGGGLSIRNGAPLLENVVFEGNQAGYGGGLSVEGSHARFDCFGAIFNGNTSAGDGGALFINGGISPALLLGATIVGNVANGGGGGIFVNDGEVQGVNLIVWDNQADRYANVGFDRNSSDVVWSYSLIGDSGGSGPDWNEDVGTDGGHNLDIDPLFEDSLGPDGYPGTGDEYFYLRPESPAIDAGTHSIPGLPEVDVLGRGRVDGSAVDMGALEFHGQSSVMGVELLPTVNMLMDAYPNPFNPRTSISFEMASTGPVVLQVFDVRGNLVKTLVQGETLAGGRHVRVWEGQDNLGNPVSGGVYLYRLSADGTQQVKKMTLLKQTGSYKKHTGPGTHPGPDIVPPT